MDSSEGKAIFNLKTTTPGGVDNSDVSPGLLLSLHEFDPILSAKVQLVNEVRAYLIISRLHSSN